MNRQTLLGWSVVTLFAGLGAGVVAVGLEIVHRLPPAPAPGPGPGPLPPAPVPVPPPAPPVDPLSAELQRLFDTAPSDEKRWRGKLVELYKVAAEAALADDSVATTDQLYHKLKNTAGAWPFKIPPTALHPIRERLAADYKAALGKVDTPLTPELRAAAEKLFGRFAAALQGLK